MIVIYLILLSRFLLVNAGLRACVPNSQFLVNGKLCNCDKLGHWNETDCFDASRTNSCLAGEVIWQGCKQCICQSNGHYTCSRDKCMDDSSSSVKAVQRLRTVMPWCNPFRSYYVDCNICVCPPSGRAAEAHCARDISCSLHREPVASDLAGKKNLCIPKVMYLFPCLHCLCTDEGYFLLDKCFETCIAKPPITETSHKCIPRSFYRKGCNVCRCPDSGVPDDTHCTKTVCNETIVFNPLHVLRNKSYQCFPHRFTRPKCHYCECNSGSIDVNTCMELECFSSTDYKYDTPKENCNPGEMVPLCTECLCLRNGVTSHEYCSTTCSYQSKLNVLERIVEIDKAKDIIDLKLITRTSGDDICDPNSIYMDLGRYCLCPENGNTNFNLCTPADDSVISRTTKVSVKISIDFNMSCEPNTFIDFDCNTCFCSKKGKIDPKWCTYDDCDAKRMIQKSHEMQNLVYPEVEMNDTCTPGSISQVECNFCICPESGDVEDRVCTKNDCASLGKKFNGDKFMCEPLAYYEVDCNICYCPNDGVKNVAKCTKNHCEKSFLRSDVCAPGQLFSEECNVCVCPPNGNKAERACTNNTCDDSAPWKKIFQLSENLIGNQIPIDATRNLDLCFPGEEFQIGCKLCACPDMGLRSYASCSELQCEEEEKKLQTKPIPLLPTLSPVEEFNPLTEKKARRVAAATTSNSTKQTRRQAEEYKEFCHTYKVREGTEGRCSPGSMYIWFCKQCICPYQGELDVFCRPLPHDFYCERPFEGQYYLPYDGPVRRDHANTTNIIAIGNRTVESNSTINPNITINSNETLKSNPPFVIPPNFLHDHTKYNCSHPGHIMDECFVCECEESGSLIEEHCFRSNAKACENAVPSFLLSDSEVPL